MDFQAPPKCQRPSHQTQTLIIFGAFLAAALSLSYATITFPGKSIDLITFHRMARAWVGGNYNQTLDFNIYPPATFVFLSPLSLLSVDTLKIVWFMLNLALTGLSVFLAIKLMGAEWPRRAKYFLLFFALTWAPFRVTLRNGQITMLIIALLLGSLLAWRRNKIVLSGVLLGLALCKYSLTFPFVFYFIWQRQWQVLLSAATIQVLLTAAFAYRLGLSLMDALANHWMTIRKFSISFPAGADFNSLLLGLTGGQRLLSISLGLIAVIFTLAAIFIAFQRKRGFENVHLALLALFALWSVYHRTYDFMLCLIPVAVLIDFIVNCRLQAFSYYWLAGFSLLALGMPGFVASRLGYETGSLATTSTAFFLFQSERLLVLAAFWSLMWVLWKQVSSSEKRSSITPDQPSEQIA